MFVLNERLSVSGLASGMSRLKGYHRSVFERTEKTSCVPSLLGCGLQTGKLF